MKLGLGDSYDKVEYIPIKIRAYADLTKPASSLGVTTLFFIGSLFFFYYKGIPNRIPEEIISIVYASFTIFLAHASSQVLNMAEDAHIDEVTPHKQNRPIPAGIVTVEEARALAIMLAVFALIRGFMTSLWFGVFVSIVLFFGIFYNSDPIRAKESIISIPWQATSRGLLSFPLIWSAYGNPFDPVAWVLGVFTFFYVLGFQNSADIIDREIDAEYGIRTWVVEFGIDNVIIIATGCTAIMIAVIMYATAVNLIPRYLVSMLSMIPLCISMLYWIKSKPNHLDEHSGNHPAYLAFYGGMVLLVIIPLVTVVII